MSTPLYVYAIGILVAVPIFILWGVGAYLLVKAIIAWIMMDPAGTGQAPKANSKA